MAKTKASKILSRIQNYTSLIPINVITASGKKKGKKGKDTPTSDEAKDEDAASKTPVPEGDDGEDGEKEETEEDKAPKTVIRFCNLLDQKLDD